MLNSLLASLIMSCTTQTTTTCPTVITRGKYDDLLKEQVEMQKKLAENELLMTRYQDSQREKVVTSDGIISNDNLTEGNTLSLLIEARKLQFTRFEERQRKLDLEELERKQQLAVEESKKIVPQNNSPSEKIASQLAANKVEEERLSAELVIRLREEKFQVVMETLVTEMPDQLERTIQLLLIRLNNIKG